MQIVNHRQAKENTILIYNKVYYSYSQLLHSSDDDQVTVVGAGVTIHEAMMAYETLKSMGIYIRVIDPFTIKPIDKELLVSSVIKTNGRIITVEDHRPEGVSSTYNIQGYLSTPVK